MVVNPQTCREHWSWYLPFYWCQHMFDQATEHGFQFNENPSTIDKYPLQYILQRLSAWSVLSLSDILSSLNLTGWLEHQSLEIKIPWELYCQWYVQWYSENTCDTGLHNTDRIMVNIKESNIQRELEIYICTFSVLFRLETITNIKLYTVKILITQKRCQFLFFCFQQLIIIWNPSKYG